MSSCEHWIKSHLEHLGVRGSYLFTFSLRSSPSLVHYGVGSGSIKDCSNGIQNFYIIFVSPSWHCPKIDLSRTNRAVVA